jgi:uncharacterized membrane protein
MSDQIPAPDPAPDDHLRGPRIWPTVRAILRTRIVAGLLTIIPIWVTYYIVRFVFDMMRSATEPLAQRVAEQIIEHNRRIAQTSKLLPEQIRGYFSNWVVPIFAVLLTLFFLYILGLFSANVFGRRFIIFMERQLGRVPMVKTIYRSTKQIVSTIGAPAGSNHRVVLVEIPRPGMKRIAFLTSVMTDSGTGRKLANLFIPYTPYLTTGYMQIVPLDDVTDTNWTFEEAAKLVMSGGIISPPHIPYEDGPPVVWDPEANAKKTKVAGT